ncbi:MAG: GDP-mannose 4,6-dehydratase [Endozoicomonadaceae bacterium]|nr:GDP-mannose 4,6-dehydratase [Endozoicomonadaceae bacterium]
MKNLFKHLSLNYEDYIKIDPTLYRPAEVDVLQGDASKARKQLGWLPKTSLETLITMMVDADIQRIKSFT